MTKYKGSDPYMDESRCVKRLNDELERHGTLYVAFDFDNTVYDYHHQGWVFGRVESLLRNCKSLGIKLILFTAKEKQADIDECINYCRQQGYEPDYINESPVMNTRKPYYNILLDDRAGLESAVKTLELIVYTRMAVPLELKPFYDE